jgi:iron-sulfur cluster repair protein YtfE (RIC family)
MGSKVLQRKIASLIQLDIDAIHAYRQAILQTEHLEVKEQLILFQQDHERHLRELSAKLIELGGVVPDEPDLKGYLIEAFTTIRSSTGTIGAIKAMHTTEKLINHSYGETVKEDFPAEIRSLIEGCRQDEEQHLRYVEEAFSEKIWEQPARGKIAHDQLFDALKKDHEEVKNILARLQETESFPERKNLVDTLRQEILPHMIGEEKVVYASLREPKEAWCEALQSIEEHHAAQLILQELATLPTGDERFRAKVSVLKEMVERHIEAEEKKIFRDLLKVLSESRAMEVLDSFTREKDTARSRFPDIP